MPPLRMKRIIPKGILLVQTEGRTIAPVSGRVFSPFSETKPSQNKSDGSPHYQFETEEPSTSKTENPKE